MSAPPKVLVAGIGSGTEPVAVHAEVSGLEPGEYFFRLEGENAYEKGTAVGGVPFTVSLPYPPLAGPPASQGVNPPGLEKSPGLQIAPGLSQAPGLKKARRREAAHTRRFRRNATIAAPLARGK